MDRRSILLLCDDRKDHAANVLHHIAAFERHSRHHVQVFNPTRGAGGAVPDLEGFDVVVLHYTLVVTIDWYVPPALRERIARFRGLKVQFIQDEYRWIDAVTTQMRELGIDVLFTLVPEPEVEKIYGPRLPGVQTVTTLAGFVADDLVGRPTPPLAARPVDVGYRGRTVPHWLGRIGQEKAEIARGFLARAPDHGLRCDIRWSETDRIYGERWIEFMTSCRATLGTESGATIADYDGSVERQVKEYLALEPAASFEEVEQAVLAPYEGNVDLKVISPRQFEAAALGTALVLFPGSYSSVLEPNRHYILLEKDFSNMNEVAERLRDLSALQTMVDRTYEDLVASGRYSLATFIREFDDLVATRAPMHMPAAARRRRVRLTSRPRLLGKLERPTDRAYRALSLLNGSRLIARRRALRRLAVAWARSDEARRAVHAGRLLDDLVKLALILDAQAGRLSIGEPFRVETRYDEARSRLILGSRRIVQAGQAPSPDGEVQPAVVKRSLEEASLQEIVWNHAAIGDHVHAPLAAGRKLIVDVGFHGMNGVHNFGSLVALGPRFPDLVFDALEPLLRAPAPAAQSAVTQRRH